MVGCDYRPRGKNNPEIDFRNMIKITEQMNFSLYQLHVGLWVRDYAADNN